MPTFIPARGCTLHLAGVCVNRIGRGKTTTITKVLADLGISSQVLPLSARKQADLDYIVELPNLGDLGTVIVDDFHRLDDAYRD
jgi:hypothetical protein